MPPWFDGKLDPVGESHKPIATGPSRVGFNPPGGSHGNQEVVKAEKAGGGEDGLGWPFGGTIYYSRVNQRCFTIPGVQSVASLVIVLDGEEVPPCTDVTINEAGLLFATEHQIEVRYSFES